MSEQDIRPASPAVDSKINAEDGRKYWQSKLMFNDVHPLSVSVSLSISHISF